MDRHIGTHALHADLPVFSGHLCLFLDPGRDESASRCPLGVTHPGHGSRAPSLGRRRKTSTNTENTCTLDPGVGDSTVDMSIQQR